MPSRSPGNPLITLLKLTSQFGVETDRRRLLERMMDCLIEVFAADRCSLLAVRADGTHLPLVARNIDEASIERQISGTILSRVLETNQVVRFQEGEGDVDPTSSIRAAEIRWALCVPLRKAHKVVGILYMDSLLPPPASTGDEDVLLEAFATHAAVALEAMQERSRLSQRADQLQEMAETAIRQVHDHRHIVAGDPVSRALLERLDKVARTEVSTLVRGASGTGKELIARAIHHASSRADGPFIAVNCGALPRELVESELFGHARGSFSGAVADKMGKFEMANGGTLFLDEIAEIPLESQPKLLRALQERVIERVGAIKPRLIDIRLIAATHANLEEMVKRGTFREDLYYRMNVFTLEIPRLHDRPGDIEPLVLRFIAEFNRTFRREIRGIDPEALRSLLRYEWPGNVRELRNVIERAFVLEEGDWLTPDSLPFARSPGAPVSAPEAPVAGTTLAHSVAAFERQVLVRSLEEHGGSVTASARSLGLSRQGLYKKLQELGIRRPAKAGDEAG